MKTRFTAVMSALALTALALAAFDGFTIKKTPKVGDTHKYKQLGKFDVQGQSLEFEAIATDKVTKIDDKGNYSIEENTSDVKINGMDTPTGQPATTTTYNPKGEIIDLKADVVSPAVRRLANMALFIMPEKDVRVGDTWSYDMKADAKNEIPSGTCKYSLLGEDKVNGIDALKIKFSIKETGTDPASSDGTVWLGKSDGALLKMSTKWSNVPVPGPSGDINITGDISLTLLS